MKLNNHKMKTVNIQRFRRGLRQPQPLSGSHDRFAICIVDDGLAPILPVRACWGGVVSGAAGYCVARSF